MTSLADMLDDPPSRVAPSRAFQRAFARQKSRRRAAARRVLPVLRAGCMGSGRQFLPRSALRSQDERGGSMSWTTPSLRRDQDGRRGQVLLRRSDSARGSRRLSRSAAVVRTLPGDSPRPQKALRRRSISATSGTPAVIAREGRWTSGCSGRQPAEAARSGTAPAPIAAARGTGPSASRRDGRESVAVSADGEAWFLLNASPEIRAQIESFPALHPRRLRDSPIQGILLTNGDLDHTLGLLSLRESQPLVVYATEAVRARVRGRQRALPDAAADAGAGDVEDPPARRQRSS